MRKEPGSIPEIVTRDQNELSALYYQNSMMQKMQSRSPELLLLDATYKLNDLRMLLYVLMVEDGNRESQVVAREDDTISALMDLFVHHNDCAAVQCVMADKDMLERDVLKEKLPQAAIQICLFHVLCTLRREVTGQKMGVSQET